MRRGPASPPSRFEFDNCAPFEISFALNAEVVAQPYTDIVPGLMLGFDGEAGTRITYTQFINEASGQDVSYVFRIRIIEPGSTGWISLERSVEHLDIESLGVLRMRLDARASTTSPLAVHLLVPQQGTEHKSIRLSEVTLQPEYQDTEMNCSLDDYELGDVAKEKPIRLALFLAPDKRLDIDIRAWSIELD
jgi:hypothetical protein